MSFAYPQALAAPYGPFPPILDVAKPGDADQKAYRARPSIPAALGLGGEDMNPHALRVRRSDFVGVTRLYLGAGPLVSTSAHNGDRTDKPAAIDAFWFCPGADAVTVSWKVRHPEDIDHALLIVRAARLERPISTVRLTAGDLANGGGAVAGCTGGKPLADVLDLAHGPHAAEFPDHVLTVEHSPYRFELTIIKKRASDRTMYPSTAWTFAHVLVHGITLEYGELAMIPAGPPPAAAAPLAARAEQAEHDLVRAVITGRLTDDTAIELPASVHQSGYIDAATPLDPVPTNVHEGVKALWGEGPRIPVRALVTVRMADGSAASYDQSRPALGRIRLMWDWRDPDPGRVDQWLVGDRGPYSHISRSYIDALITAPTVGPRGSANCPAAHGGRRGTGAPAFRPCDPGHPQHNVVDQASVARPWAAISEMGAGPHAHVSTALFTPGIVSGDQFKLAVYLTSADDYERYHDDDKPILHVDEPDDERLSDAIARLSAERRPPLAETGTFELSRRTRVLLLEDSPGTNAVPQLAVQQHYQRFFGLRLDLATRGLRADLWRNDHTGAPLDYDRLMQWVRSSHGSIAPLLALVRPPPDIGPHLVAVRSRTELLDIVRQRLREGHGHVVETTSLVGDWHRFGATELYILGPHAPSSDPGSAAHKAMFVERGALPAPGTVSTNSLWALPTTLRLCFSAEAWVDDLAPAHREDRIVVTFTAAGHAHQATLDYGSGRLGRVERTPPNAAAAAIDGALDQLVAAMDGHPVFDAPLTITLTARNRNERDTERLDRAKQLVRERLRRRFEPLDVERVVAAFLAAPFANTNAPLDAERYGSTLKECLKSLMLEVLERVRGVELAGEEGLLYFDVTAQARFGVVPVGGFMEVARVNTNPPEIRTTLFKAVGYQILRSASTRDYALQAFCSVTDTMLHEFGHAYWRPHAPRATWGFTKFADRDYVRNHVPHDTCLMNYDVDPGRYFCGRCVLLLRGWTNLPETDPGVADAAQAIPLLARTIDAEPDATRKAWKQLRLAYLHDKANDPASAMNEVSRALHTFGPRDGSPDHIAFRRTAIRGYLQTAPERLIDAYARPLWRELIALAPRFADLWDLDRINTPFFPDAPWKVEIVEGYGVTPGPATQYINLPPERRFVDGRRVTSVDRLGARVRFKISFSTAGDHQVRYRLVGHAHDYPAGAALEPGFASNDVDYTVPLGLVAAASLAGARATTITLDLAGHARPGTRVRLLVHHAASDECIESPDLAVRQLLFYLKQTADGRARGQAIADDGAFTTALDDAYAAAGIDFVHLGSHQLALTDFHYDNNRRRLTPLIQEIDQASDTQCAAPFTPLAPTYADYRPHLYVFTFVDTVIHRMGQRQHVVQLADHDPAQPVSILLSGTLGAEFAGSVLWDGETPADLPEHVLDPGVYGAYLNDYRTRAADARWFVRASFTRADGLEIPLGAADLDTAEGIVSLPGRRNRIDVDLARVAGSDPVTGALRVHFLWATYQGGVSVKEDSAHHNVAVIATRPSYAAAAFDADTQHSAAIHELGHALGMVPIGQQTHFNIRGSGPHCWTGLDDPRPDNLHEPDYYAARLADAACVMFYRLRPDDPLLTFCPTCAASLRALDLTGGFR